MIDRQKRQRAREMLLDFVNGQMTNDELEEEFPVNASDRALSAIYKRIWFLWDDGQEHILKGQHAPREAERAMIIRAAAFLSSDLEYRWPENMEMVPAQLILSRLLRLKRVAERIEERRIAQLRRIGDPNAWPFISLEQESAIIASDENHPNANCTEREK